MTETALNRFTPLIPFGLCALLVACGGGSTGTTGGSSSGGAVVTPADPAPTSGTLLATKFFGDFLSAYPTAYPAQVAIPTATPAVGARINAVTDPRGVACSYAYTYSAPAALVAGPDPYFSRLWHLSNTAQVAPGVGGLAATRDEDIRALAAWTSNKGEGVRIAVIDDAIEIVHADLVPNVLAGTSLDYGQSTPTAFPLPCKTDDTHGTAVAGIIAARDNNSKGSAGVSPRVQLSAFNALATGYDTDIADALNREQQAISVYHNSWGSADNGVLHSADNLFLSAIYRGVRLGRNGKGSIYVFPAGNGGCIYQVGNSCVEENSNFDGYVNSPAVITVCAVDDHGEQPYYGERGANILVCAPSSNYSDQNMLTTLKVKGDVRDDFGGTSASAPMVSGVVALMLSANPSLTWRDVRIILAQTARKNNTTDSRWNSASGMSFNDKYGFGVVDAGAAVAAAKSWTTVGGSSTLKTCDIGTQAVNGFIPDLGNKSAGFAVNCPQITRIEYVEVVFTSQHDYAGDLRIELTSPTGAVSELATPRVCKAANSNTTIDCGDYTAWRFGSVRHLNEGASGTWTLKVTDALAQGSGTWVSWGLRIHGR